MMVTFIILFINVTFGLLFDDFSIHAHSFISKSFIILVQKSLLIYHTHVHVHKTNSSFIW